MAVKKPVLLARPFYYAARRGWIRFDQYAPYRRFTAVLYIFRFSLWRALTRLTPRPVAALLALLFGRDRYLVRLSQSSSPVDLSISPMNLLGLLHLGKLGYNPISVDPVTHTLLMPMGSGLIISLRPARSGDIGLLKELLLDRDYGDDFPGYKVLDVGAYVGATALFFCSHGAQKVIAAEPALDNYELAQKNIAQSPYANQIVLLQAAVAATDGEMPFYLDEKNPHMHALLPPADNQPHFTSTKTVSVPVWSFARLMDYTRWEEVDLVKLDCEGAEFPILLETEASVLRRVRRWVIEYHGVPEPLERRLRELGYRVIRTRDMIMNGILHAQAGDR